MGGISKSVMPKANISFFEMFAIIFPMIPNGYLSGYPSCVTWKYKRKKGQWFSHHVKTFMVGFTKFSPKLSSIENALSFLPYMKSLRPTLIRY
jgi:hypothetical protein